MDWDKLRIFYAVAEAGSFTHAGEALNLSQSAISRQISALEDSLKVTLFHRHARGLILTEQGEVLHSTARDVFAKLAMTEAMLTESKLRPRGPLKVTTTFAFGVNWLTPRLGEFLELYPDIQMTLLIDDRELDLAMREADVAIRMMPPRQPDLIQRHLMTIQFHVYGHARYLERRGSLEAVSDLDRHDLIAYPRDSRSPIPTMNWLLEEGMPEGASRVPLFRVNNVYAIQQAMESGLGLAALPDYMVEGRPGVTRVLPEVSGPAVEVYFVYAEELRHSKRIAVFRDFLVRKVGETAF
jgi:DNA-binding transcriptional LysR family regulator